MRYPIKLLVLIIIISLSSLSVVQAQLLIAPVIIIEKDVLFRWTLDEGLVEVAPLPDEYERVLISPTSDLALIITQTPEALQTIEEECPCGGAYWPTNFTAVDMLTGEIIEVAPQEAGIPTIEQIQRSLPVFSPDGTQLAWIAGSEVSSLVIYDFATGETQTIAEEIQSQTRVSQPAAITAWTSAGIFVEQVDFDAVGDLHDGFAVYSSDGERLVDTLSLETLLPNSTYFIPSVPPVHYFHRNNGYFIADYQDSSVIMSESERYNLADDSVTSLGGGTVYLTAATYPDAGSAIYMSPPMIRDDGKRIFDIYQNGQVIQNSTSLPLLSPEGNAAIIDFGLAEGGGVQFTLWQAESDVTDLVILDMFPDFIDWGGYAYRWEPGRYPPQFNRHL